MMGITTNNPLPMHYHCSECHHHEWVKDNYRSFEINGQTIDKEIKNGLDLERKVCPDCGKEMWSDGFDGDFRSFCGADLN